MFDLFGKKKIAALQEQLLKAQDDASFYKDLYAKQCDLYKEITEKLAGPYDELKFLERNLTLLEDTIAADTGDSCTIQFTEEEAAETRMKISALKEKPKSLQLLIAAKITQWHAAAKECRDELHDLMMKADGMNDDGRSAVIESELSCYNNWIKKGADFSAALDGYGMDKIL